LEKKKVEYQSINQNVYSAPSRYMYLHVHVLRGAPDPGQAEKHSVMSLI